MWSACAPGTPAWRVRPVPCGETGNGCDNLSYAASYYIAATAPYFTKDCGTYVPAEQLQTGELLNSVLELAGLDSRRITANFDDAVLLRPLHIIGCRATTATRNVVINGTAQNEVVESRTYYANGLTETLSQFTNGVSDGIDDIVTISPMTGLMTSRITSCPNLVGSYVVVEFDYDDRRRLTKFRTLQPEDCFNAATTGNSVLATAEYRDGDVLPDFVDFHSIITNTGVSKITVSATVDSTVTRDAFQRIVASSKVNTFQASVFLEALSITVSSADTETWAFAYNYEASGQLTSQTVHKASASSGETTTGEVVLEYDDGGRVTKVSGLASGPSTSLSIIDNYTYNSDGNLIRRDVSQENSGTISTGTITYAY